MVKAVLLKASDVKSVAAPARKAQALEAETTWKDALELVNVGSTTDACLKPLGMLMVRVGLKLTNTEKKGPERKEFTMDEVRREFLAQASKIVGSPIEFDKWTLSSASSAPDPSDAKADEAKAKKLDALHIATLEDHDDSSWICKKAGFSVGLHVVEKRIEMSAENVFVIFSISKEVVLHQVCSFNNQPRKITIAIEELLSNWSVTKAEPPTKMNATPSLPTSFAEAVAKNEIFKSLFGLFNKNQQKTLSTLCYYRRPDQVRSEVLIKEGACRSYHWFL